ncbi:MAG TPA: Crp/Fnr family transcriptional regulator [Ginsengibacter sp.]
MISQKLLLSRGGTIRRYKKNQNVFFEGNMPKFYYQVIEGNIKMVSVNENGREFIQGVFGSGQSFGEPVLLINKPYPATAVVLENTQLIRLPREEFIKMLMEYPDIIFQFSKVLAQRIYDKAQLAKAMTLYTPEQRITAFFKTLKDPGNARCNHDYKVKLSRQAIADMIGFRVETVIRTIKNLEKKSTIKIEKGKIYL